MTDNWKLLSAIIDSSADIVVRSSELVQDTSTEKCESLSGGKYDHLGVTIFRKIITDLTWCGLNFLN